MKTAMIIRGKKFHVKYENGIVSVKRPESIGWVTSYTTPTHNLTDEEIGEMAQGIVKGLGL